MNNAEKEYNALANALAALSTDTAPNWRAGVLATWARGYMETRPDYTAIDALTDCLAELQNGQTLTGQYWCDKYPKLYDALNDTGHLDGKGSVVARALELINSGGAADCLPTHGASREPLPEITSTRQLRSCYRWQYLQMPKEITTFAQLPRLSVSITQFFALDSRRILGQVFAITPISRQ